MIDDDAIAGAGHHSQNQCKTTHCAIHYHDFICPGGKPARYNVRQSLPQREQTQLVVPGQGRCGVIAVRHEYTPGEFQARR
jgi:hypothetical protein